MSYYTILAHVEVMPWNQFFAIASSAAMGTLAEGDQAVEGVRNFVCEPVG